ncbi:MAG: hypothetical protein PWP23_1377 [Candidatus Sumerlaeota bacterium]|nr:hypothetical protein [Candidatus Sumerlaeota bacterium]
MEPRVELVSYFLRKFVVEGGCAPRKQAESALLPVPTISIEQRYNPENPNNRAIFMTVLLEPKDKDDYRIQAEIMGLFDVTGDATKEKIAGVAALNGASILYGILRSEISSLTANFIRGRALLPAVYMKDVLANSMELLPPDSVAAAPPPASAPKKRAKRA